MGRAGGYGSETTEFVTKRVCLLSVLSISFLCSLAGFIVGRFVSDQVLAMRDARMLEDLDANGLALTQNLRDELMKLLNQSSYHDQPDMIPELKELNDMKLNRTLDLFKDLSLFRLNVEEQSGCIVATICGTQEPDRYIVLSANQHGYDIAYKVAKSFDHLYRDKDQSYWQPKRSLIFCACLGKQDGCRHVILERIKPKIVAYIAIHGTAAIGQGKIAISGTGMVQATMVDAVEEVKEFNDFELSVVDSPIALQKLNVNEPHVALSYLDENGTNHYSSENQKTLAQIAGITMFRLSEGIFHRWNPKYFAGLMNKTLDKISRVAGVQESKANLNKTVNNLIKDIEEFNVVLDKTNMLKLLAVRMMNEKLIDLDRALICRPPAYSGSRVDFSIFNKLSSNGALKLIVELNAIKDCYQAANRIILDQAQCSQIANHESDDSDK